VRPKRRGKVTDSLISVSTSTASNMGTTSVLPECIKLLQNNSFPIQAHGPCGALAKRATKARVRPAPAGAGGRDLRRRVPRRGDLRRFRYRGLNVRAAPSCDAPHRCREAVATPWSLGLSGTFSAGVRPDARVFRVTVRRVDSCEDVI
jgi:hypothetical protein